MSLVLFLKFSKRFSNPLFESLIEFPVLWTFLMEKFFVVFPIIEQLHYNSYGSSLGDLYGFLVKPLCG
jgi:hypothetical protein